MSKLNYALFIGGVANGALLQVDTDQKVVVAKTPESPEVNQLRFGGSFQAARRIETSRYVRHYIQLAPGDPRMVVYVTAGMELGCAMMKVFTHYTRQ